ncbi:MAG: class I SAM-dependent methyltransferase [Candidatus Babeliales bacterium]
MPINKEAPKQNNQSIIFNWDNRDFDFLLKSCEKDDEILFTLKYLNDKDLKILEAGCGLGRAVKYFYDKGYKNICGIELNKDSVVYLNNFFPELNVIHGNILNMPYEKNYFDVILSYGVIEHFENGSIEPMLSMYNCLKPGGIAIVTVPSFNFIRKSLYFFSFFDFRKYNLIRKIFKKKELKYNGKKFSYYIDPQIGKFFEYRFTPKQFINICKKSGFDIIESKPIAHVDGLFHIFGPPLVYFKDWQFTLSKFGKFVNKILSKIPFMHNHMHLCVLKKKGFKI